MIGSIDTGATEGPRKNTDIHRTPEQILRLFW